MKRVLADAMVGGRFPSFRVRSSNDIFIFILSEILIVYIVACALRVYL